MRARDGRTLPFMFRSEDASVPIISERFVHPAASFMPMKLRIGIRMRLTRITEFVKRLEP